jgi:hypothetical protein
MFGFDGFGSDEGKALVQRVKRLLDENKRLGTLVRATMIYT